MLSYYNRVYVDFIIKKDKLYYNASSGINLLLSNPELIKYNENKTLSLFDSGDDSVFLAKKKWGIFDIYYCTAFWRKNEIQRIALTGCVLDENDNIALYLTNRNRPLYLCGKTIIKGKCFLPADGVARGNIVGMNFSGNKLVDGEILKSANILPPPNKEIQDYTVDNIKKEYILDSIQIIEKPVLMDSIRNSFNQKTLILYSPNTLLLNNYIKGNVIVFSDKVVEISKDAKIEDIIICAPYIKINKGFEGRVQALSSDSILVEEECYLKYPSSLMVINSKICEKDPFINISEKVKLGGVVFLYKKVYQTNHNSFVYISKDSKINGQVYTNGIIDLKGSVFGTVYCDRFLLQTPSSIYENHLLDAVIDFSKLSKYYVGATLFTNVGKRKIIKWLY